MDSQRYLAIKFQEMEEKMQRDRNRNRMNNIEDVETSTETTAMDDIAQTGETDTYQTETPSTVSANRIYLFERKMKRR